MEIQEIQSFIDETIYDLQTMDFLLNYGRIKETVPVTQQILERLQLFRAQMGQKDFQDVFPEAFWDREFLGPWKIRDLCAKIKVLSQKAILEKDLEAIDYKCFIEIFRSWCWENISQLKQRIKSPFQKNYEFLLTITLTCVVGFFLVSIVFLSFYLQNWGLRGDFYKGENFEEHVSTGTNKIINFGYYLEMNPLMPKEHASARWQGFLIAPKSGTYALSLVVDDGARLFIDGHLLINAWHDNDSVEFSQKIFLSKGTHALQLDYYNHWEKSILKLYWAFDAGKKEIIPALYLRHKDNLL